MADGHYADPPGVERYLFQVENDVEHAISPAYRAHFHCPDGIGELL
jgi:hypothetical protein